MRARPKRDACIRMQSVSVNNRQPFEARNASSILMIPESIRRSPEVPQQSGIDEETSDDMLS
jgi:hypothetical protein